jgi:murein L,D-transpeptidase YcbB/YkuD
MAVEEDRMHGGGPILALTAFTASVALLSLDSAVAGTAGAPSPQPRSTTPMPARQAPLHLGNRGAKVRNLQQRLILLRYLAPASVDGVFGRRTWHAVVAFQGWQRLPRDGVVGARTRAALASAARPRPWIRLTRGLELDLNRQVLLVVARGKTVRAVHISSAASGYSTPRGRFDVYRRERLSWSSPYQVWMPYALYFHEGYAIHAFGSVPAYPASHGCVRVPTSEAPVVFAAAPLHTPVVIR